LKSELISKQVSSELFLSVITLKFLREIKDICQSDFGLLLVLLESGVILKFGAFGLHAFDHAETDTDENEVEARV